MVAAGALRLHVALTQWNREEAIDEAIEHLFPRNLDSPSRARGWAAPFVADACAAEEGQGALLVLSELVTNAVRHGDGDVLVTLSCHEDAFVVAVFDEGGGVVEPRRHDPWATGGRGLRIVGGLAEKWGVEPSVAGGKTVWARLATAPRSARTR
ncbi:MAG: ATP-binding protein [Acidimicrobiales bacterium]